MTNQERQQHIAQLCERYKITHKHVPLIDESRFHVERITRTNRWLGERSIFTPSVLSTQVYGVALHEVGHIARKAPTRLGDERVSHSRALKAEATAWQWAVDHAKEPLDAELISRYAKSYIEDETWPQYALPRKRHPIWKFVLP